MKRRAHYRKGFLRRSKKGLSYVPGGWVGFKKKKRKPKRDW